MTLTRKREPEESIQREGEAKTALGCESNDPSFSIEDVPPFLSRGDNDGVPTTPPTSKNRVQESSSSSPRRSNAAGVLTKEEKVRITLNTIWDAIEL